MKGFETLIMISVKYFCKINPAWFKCLKMINNKKKSLEIKQSN